MTLFSSSFLFFLLFLSLLLPLHSISLKPNPLHSKEQRYAQQNGFLNGVNFGGWLVTEPSWMYDQFSAPAENDLLRQWRQKNGDNYTLQTIHNHWSNYITTKDLNNIQQFGITHARIPVGYWIVDVPTTPASSSMYDYGFNAEGFATGGLNYLEPMIANLKTRGIQVIIDLHSPPGAGSSCSSYSGIIESDENESFWRGYPWTDAHTPPNCDGGPYTTSRSSSTSWLEVGENFLLTIATWVVKLQSNSSLSDTVVGLELVNEPGLGWGGLQSDIEGYISTMVPQVQTLFNQNGLSYIEIDTNWIGPNDNNAAGWLAEQQTTKWASSPPTNVDFHNYYNWYGPEGWPQLATIICQPTSPLPWDQYIESSPPQNLWIGEWSDATNLDNPAYTNFSDPDVAQNLAVLHANQMSLYFTSPHVIGQFYWTLRMGSGWQPWPTDDCPNGCQVPGTSSSQSLPSFNYRVWNFLELIENNIALPLSQYNITGLCQCNGCDGDVPFEFEWEQGSDCMYAHYCDFPGNDIAHKQCASYECSDFCNSYSGCTNFAYSDYQGGTCWAKGGDIPPQAAVQNNNADNLCGIMTYEGQWETSSSSSSSVGTGCDFINNDISNSIVDVISDCEILCEQQYSCTNYVWVSNASTCYLKRGNIPQSQAIVSQSTNSCGIMI